MNTQKSSTQSSPDAPSAKAVHKTATTPKKGRPTPSRKQARAARMQPLVPTDRKEAKRRSKAQQRAQANREHAALTAGDEENYPLHHRGADRRLVRDVVDARHNLAEYFLPFALLAMLVTFPVQFAMPQRFAMLSAVVVITLWVGIFAVVVDSFLLRRKIRAALTERFGTVPPGRVTYGILRSTNIRPWRMPKPKIKHGEKPRR